jgi:hypothetical protein
MLVKWFALGLWGRGPSTNRVGYFTDAWHWLDALIVFAGFVNYIPGLGSNASALRTFRVLRPLKSLSAFPSMRVVVSSMLTALPALGNVVLLAVFTLIVFGIIGVQLWAGLLRGKCAYDDPLSPGTMVFTDTGCGLPCDQQEGAECTPTGGDDCPAMLVSYDLPWFDPALNGTAYNATIETRQTFCMATENPGYGLVTFDDSPHAMLTIFTGITLEGWTDTLYATQAAWGTKWLVALYWIVVVAFGAFFLLQLALAVIWESYQSSQASEEDKADETLSEHGALLLEHIRKKRRAGSLLKRARALLARALCFWRRSGASSAAAVHAAPAGGSGGGGTGTGDDDGDHTPRAGESAQQSVMRQLVDLIPKPKPKKVHPPIFAPLSAVTSDPRFANSLTFVIVLNTIQLAMPYNGMSDAYVHGLDVANYIFSAVFGVEMILKLCGDGPKRYLSDSFNVFDGFIVLLSFVDIGLTVALGDAAGGLSALRTFRLARVFKLARQWKDLARLLATIIKSLKNVSSAVGVLGIVLFIFTLLSMQLFGGGFDKAVEQGIIDEVPRAHYDDFWTAFVSTFQTTTGENWNEQLQVGNIVFGPVFIIVLVALQLIGSYIFLNLFLAILLGAFESEMDAEKVENERAAKDVSAAAKNAALNSSAGGGSETYVGASSPTAAAMSATSSFVLSAAPGGIHDASSKGGVVVPVPRFLHSHASDPGGEGTTFGAADKPEALPLPVPAAAAAVLSALVVDPSSASSVPASLDATVARAVDPPLAGSGTSLAGPPKSPGAAPTPTLGGVGSLFSPPSLAAAGERSPSGRSAPLVLPPIVGARPLPPIPAGAATGTIAALAPAAAASAAAAPGSSSSSAPGTRGSSKSPSPSSSPVPPGASSSPSASPAAPGLAVEGSDGGGQTTDLQMVVKGGTTQSFVTTVKREDGKEMAVRVLASGDIQVVSGGAQTVGSVWDPDSAYRKLGVLVDPVVGADGKVVPAPAPPLSLSVLSVAHPLRRAAAVLVAHPWFEQFILLLILISSINLALDEPRVMVCKLRPSNDPDNCIALAAWLSWSDVIITALFVLEMVAKIVALGFSNHKTAYLRNPWNVLDFLIVIISVLSLALADLASKLRALRSLRALRALRPLRVVSRYPGLKLVVNAVIGALPKVKNVLLINFLFLLLLAIVGLQNFSGSLSYCNDSSVAEKADCTGDWTLLGDNCAFLPHPALEQACRETTEGAQFPRRWQPVTQNFDDIFQAIRTVFEVATGEAWPDIMEPVVDSVGPGKPMQREANPLAALYFIIIQVACGFFLLELFTGVIIANYYQLKEEAQGSGLLTEQQQKWVEQMKLMLSINAARNMQRPAGEVMWLRRLRNRAFAVVISKAFEWAIMGVILLNTIVLAIRHYGENEDFVRAEERANDVFAAIFFVEAALKLAAFGPRQYFSVLWNKFDFALVAASIIGWAVDVGPLATLFRIFRVARIIRLVRTSRGLLMLFRTLIVSIPALANVGIILILLLFVFSIVGMNLFAGVRYNGFGNLGDDANFDSFFTAMLTLFRCSTGENYNGLMHDLEVQPPYCLPHDAEDGSGLLANCGDTVAPSVYFCLFVTLASFVLIKLLVAVVLDSFSDMLASEEESDTFKLTPDSLDAYAEAWGVCDPEATKFMREGGLLKLVQLLDFPLGVRGSPEVQDGKTSPRKAAFRLLSQLELPPSADGRYQFHAVLQELVKRASQGASAPKTRVHVAGDLAEAQHSVRETLAAIRIQGLFRAKHARARILALIELKKEEIKEKAAARLVREREEKAAALAAGGGGAGGAAGAGADGSRSPTPGSGGVTSFLRRTFSRSANVSSSAAAGGAAEKKHAQAVLTAAAAAHPHAQRHRWGQRDKERREKDKILYNA